MSETAEKPKVPKLRFPEFEGEWKEKPLSFFGDTISGLTYSPSDVREKGLLVLRSSNVQAGQIVLDDCVYVEEGISSANIANEGDILICVRNGSANLIGKSAVIGPSVPRATHGAFMTVFRTNEWEFVAQLFDTQQYKKQVAADLGARINSINSGQLKRYKFAIPPGEDERSSIAAVLMALDEKAIALTRKRSSLEAYKTGLMQRLFSQELRFTREDGSPFPDWEKREFSELAEPSGDRFDPSNSNEVPLVVELDNIEAGTGRIRGLSGLEGQVSQKSVFKQGDVLFAKLRPYLRKFWKASVDGVCSTEIWVLRPKSVSSKFLYALVQTSKFQQLVNQSAGSKMPRADWKVVGGASFTVPNSEEAEKIAGFLSAVDDRIEAVVKQIEAMQCFKKGLLQQMFA